MKQLEGERRQLEAELSSLQQVIRTLRESAGGSNSIPSSGNSYHITPEAHNASSYRPQTTKPKDIQQKPVLQAKQTMNLDPYTDPST
jgi:uncharacterized protein (DUF362 family)